MTTKIWELKVSNPAKPEERPLLLRFTDQAKLHSVAHILRADGYCVAGEYDHATAGNHTPREAVELARLFLGKTGVAAEKSVEAMLRAREPKIEYLRRIVG